jgi:hypothetical protein
MKKILGIIILLISLVRCTTASNGSLENNKPEVKVIEENSTTATKGSIEKIKQEETAIYENGRYIFKNNNFVFIAQLTNDIDKITDYWFSVPIRQEFPDIQTIKDFNKNDPLSVFIVYSSNITDINLTYDEWLTKPDGSESSKGIRSNIERGLYNNNLVGAKVYRGKISEIEKGNIPRNTLFRASQLHTTIFDENSLFGKYQFNVNIYNKGELITNFSLEFNRIK